jgi:predicted secreted protein
MRQILTTAAAGLAVLLALPAMAQDNAPTYDRVSLNATAEREVENDLLIAIVYAEVEDSDQSDAADQVNTAIQWAADRARRAGDIVLQTTQYNTRPIYANGRRITGWVARQSLRLESTDAEKLSELLGTLQDRVAVQSISYGLSKAARDAAEDELIAEALTRFDRRASLVASELGREGYRIVQIDVGTPNGFFSPVAMRAQAFAQDSVAAPEIEAGVQRLTVSVGGTIELDSGG